MAGINHIVLIGRLVRDPELRYTTLGTPVARFTLAVDRRPRMDGTKEADFIQIIVWGKQGESCANFLTNGRQVAVEGHLQIRIYQGDDGQNHKNAEVVAEKVQFLSPKNKPGGPPLENEAPSSDAEVP